MVKILEHFFSVEYDDPDDNLLQHVQESRYPLHLSMKIGNLMS